MPIWILQTIVICQLHWSSNFDTIEVQGKIHFHNLPSVWPGIPNSLIPTSSAIQSEKKKKKNLVRLKIKLIMKQILFF